jgi:hypothetical protein
MIKVYRAKSTLVDISQYVPKDLNLDSDFWEYCGADIQVFIGPVMYDHAFKVNDDIIVVEDMGAEKLVVVVPSVGERESIWQSEPCRIYRTINLELVEKGEISYSEALSCVEGAYNMSRFDMQGLPSVLEMVEAYRGRLEFMAQLEESLVDNISV